MIANKNDEKCPSLDNTCTVVSTLQRPSLHLDLYGQQEQVLILEIPTPQGPELHLALSILQKSVLHNDVSSRQGLEPHLDMSTVQRPLQHLDVSIPKGPKLYLDFLSSSSVLVAFPFGKLGLVWTTEAFAAPGFI
jgi:hypothetical protein